MPADPLHPRAPGPRLVAVALVVSLCGLAAAIPSAADPQTLPQAENQLERIRRQYEAEQSKLAGIRQRLNEAATRLAEAEFALEDTRTKLDETRAAIGAARERFAELQQRLWDRARLAYMGGPGGSIEFLLGSATLSDLSDRVQFLDSVSQRDADLAAEVASEQAQLRFLRNELEQLQAKQAGQVTQARERKATIAGRFAEQDAVLTKMHKLEAQAEALVKRFKQAVNPIGGGGGVVGGPGPFHACPVPGGGVSNSFGAPRAGHLHQGDDIFAGYGDPIVAPFAGSVTRSSSTDGGLQAYVHGSQGWVFNAHLSRYHAGGHVHAGEVIGYVGTSGNAQGTSAHDHFEWHPNVLPDPSQWPASPYGYSVIGDAVNPYPLLVQVC